MGAPADATSVEDANCAETGIERGKTRSPVPSADRHVLSGRTQLRISSGARDTLPMRVLVNCTSNVEC